MSGHRISRRRALGALGALPVVLASARASAQDPAAAPPDGGPYVPTPWAILDEMLKLADIRADDTVFDLGSGDGRLVIAAAARHGARGVGVERHADLVELSRAYAEKNGVGERVRFVQGDVLETDVREATVVMMYLLPRLVVRLVPKLRAELPVGARIVSHDYALDPWRADKTMLFDVDEKYAITGSPETKLFYYVVPARVHGEWTLELAEPIVTGPLPLAIEQWPDRLTGAAIFRSGSTELRELAVRGEAIRFEILHDARIMAFTGRVTGATMAGEMRSRGVSGRWTARRSPS
jgi:SAM-dependent methyltransferase